MTARHYHPVYTLHFLRRSAPVYLLPPFVALLQWDWAGFHALLRQEALILAAMVLLAAVQYACNRWRLDEGGALHLHTGVLAKRHTLIRRGQLAALRMERKVGYRLLGASTLTLYFTADRRPVTLYLSKRDAAVLAEALLPAPTGSEYHPTGTEWLGLCLLSADVAATGLLAVVAVQQTKRLAPWAEELAKAQLEQLVALAQLVLPAGTALLLVAAGLLAAISFARGVLHAAGYRARRCENGLLLAEGGWLHFSQTRVRTACIAWAEERCTLWALLLRRRPVYVAAGGYTAELPLIVYPYRDVQAVRRLLPGYIPPAGPRCPLTGRSLPAYLGLPGGLLGSFVLLCLLARQFSPALLPMLAIPTILSALLLPTAVAGFLWEGAWLEGGTLLAVRGGWYTLHRYCFFRAPVQLAQKQSPWAVPAHRADLRLLLPAGRQLRLRSMPLAACARLEHWMQQQ